jgi:hypothetical protein
MDDSALKPLKGMVPPAGYGLVVVLRKDEFLDRIVLFGLEKIAQCCLSAEVQHGHFDACSVGIRHRVLIHLAG